MATQLAASSATGTETAAPFMLSPSPVDPDFAAAMRAAAVSEAAFQDVSGNTRCRVSYFLCELANQLRHRGGHDLATPMPLTRYDISDELDISLSKVKRVLALLSLSGVLRSGARGLEVLDWQRLWAVAHVDPQPLVPSFADGGDDLIAAAEILELNTAVTTAGDPACFV